VEKSIDLEEQMSASSPLETRLEQKGNAMKKRSGKQQQMLERLVKLPDANVDLSDLPERLDWSGAERGKFYGPVK
jgi:hypothetical protein